MGEGVSQTVQAHLCTSCTKLCVFIKKTSRSAFFCSVAAWVSSTLAICMERAQGPVQLGASMAAGLPAPWLAWGQCCCMQSLSFVVGGFFPQGEKCKVTNKYKNASIKTQA